MGYRGQVENQGLPPRTAWKDPDKWLDCDDDGRVLRVKPEQRHTLKLPCDERGLLMGSKVVKFGLDELFCDEYDWFLDGDRRCDNHHLYYDRLDYHPRKFDGNTTARDFRECAANRVYVVRSYHEALHAVAQRPQQPSLEVMHDFLAVYNESNALYRQLGDTAMRAHLHHRQVARLVDQKSGVGLTDDDYDWVKRTFSRHYDAYRQAYEAALEGVPHRPIAEPIDSVREKLPESTQLRPGTVVRFMQPFTLTQRLSAVDVRALYRPSVDAR